MRSNVGWLARRCEAASYTQRLWRVQGAGPVEHTGEKLRNVDAWWTFGLLGLAIASVWWPSHRTAGVGAKFPWFQPWKAVLLLVGAAGLLSGVISPPAVLVVAALWAACAWTFKRDGNLAHPWGLVPVVLLVLALALHAFPWFHNLRLIDGEKLSANAAPFTLYANADKAVAGLLLLAYGCRRLHVSMEARPRIWLVLRITLTTVAAVLALGWVGGYVRPDIKWPVQSLVFLSANLLFTCVAEEAFFRGLIQERLVEAGPPSRSWMAVSVIVSAVLFGLAHIGGGWPLMALATVAGLGYAYAYAQVRCIEAPVFVHFGVNAAHWLLFTYPRLA